LRAHLWSTANTLDMIPLLGPPGPGSITGSHPAILVAVSAGLVILDADPVWLPSAGSQPAWCEALVQVPGWARPMRAYSIDLPSDSSVEQRSQADRLATRVAELGELAVAGGNWNSYGRADVISPSGLNTVSLPLRPLRMRYDPQNRTLTPNYDVHDVLTSIGMEEAVALLHSRKGDLEDLTPDGTVWRTDRIYMTKDIAGAATRYISQDIGDSDHQAQMLILDGLTAARAFPPGPGRQPAM